MLTSIYNFQKIKFTILTACPWLFWALLLFPFAGCQKENRFDCFKSTGRTETHARKLQPFTKIRVFDNIEVILIKDTAHYVELIAGENLMSSLNTEVSDGTLTLTNTNKCNWVRSYKRDIKAIVHAQSFEQVIHDGVKTVRTLGTLSQDTIRLDITDAGDFDCTLQSDKVYVTMYEYGNITLKGSASLFVFENFGIGKLFAQQMAAGTIYGSAAGQGDNHVLPLDFLGVDIRKSGNVFYYNEPAEIEKYGAGSGNLLRRP